MLDKSIAYVPVKMSRKNSAAFQKFKLPQGFSLAFYEPKFYAGWVELMLAVDHFDSRQEAEEYFEKVFLSESEKLADSYLFVLDSEGQIAACGALWEGEFCGKQTPRLHWIAAAPKQQGKGLVKALLTQLIEKHERENPQELLYLTTQTWSYKAVNLYEQFGFKAVVDSEEARRAWQLIKDKINSYELTK